MNIVEMLNPDDLIVGEDLKRSGSAKQFEERLRASIDQIGLTEPIKVARTPQGKYLVVDGTMRLHAIRFLRDADKSRFPTIPAYIVDYDRRFEIRYQTDIYQDLLPSQLAVLVEHLHKTERVRKSEIARYIGVSPATLRNYTGLWRLLQRKNLFASIVDLMDSNVIPSSNPYAWLRLTDDGIRHVIETSFSSGVRAEDWIVRAIHEARSGLPSRFTTKFVEEATTGLEPHLYRGDEDLRHVKRDLGLRRVTGQTSLLDPAKSARSKPLLNPVESASSTPRRNPERARRHLAQVVSTSSDPVLHAAAIALKEYLK